MKYLWHGRPCELLVKPVFKRGIKRNALIEFWPEKMMVVPQRALRRVK